ncbi:MAG: OmpA family protein [Haliscomenobacter sp.]|nr:OmpA family protein [Haliscomenobacter sp.]
MRKVVGVVLVCIGMLAVRLEGQAPASVQSRWLFSQTANPESNPVVSINGAEFFCTFSKHPSNFGLSDKDDIWQALQTGTSQFSRPVNAGNPLNDDSNNQVMGISLDGNVLFLWNREDSGLGSLAYSRRQGRSWQRPEPMRIEGWENKDIALSHWHVSVEADILVLAAAIPGESEDENLYVSRKIRQGLWSTPIPIGPAVNSPYRETSAFIAPDGHSLYFSSDRPGGMGGTDLYLSRRLDDTWSNWSAPISLGPGINSPEDESQFFFSETDERAFFTVGRPGQDSRIYCSQLPLDLLPSRMFLLSGQVLAEDASTPVRQAKICVYSIENNASQPIRCGAPLDQNGRFLLLVPQSQTIGIYAQCQGFFSSSSYFVPGGSWQEQVDHEPGLLAELYRSEPLYRQRDQEIDKLQSRKLELSRLIPAIEKMRADELARIATLCALPGQKDSVLFSSNFYLQQLRSSYDATREQYIKSWSVEQEFLFRGDADPGDPYSLYAYPGGKVYPQTAEGRIQELRERQRRKVTDAEAQDAFRETATDAPLSFAGFYEAVQIEMAYLLKDSVLRILENELIQTTLSSLRGTVSESQLPILQGVGDKRMRKLNGAPSEYSLARLLPQSPYPDPVRQRWQEPIADSLRVRLFQETYNQLLAKLENPVKAFLEFDMLLDLHREQSLFLSQNIEHLIQKQISLEKSYRKKMAEENAALEEAGDTLLVFGIRTAKLDIAMHPIKDQSKVQLDNILFEPNSAQLQPVSRIELSRLAELLIQNPSLRADIEIHTNSLCSHSFAQEITQERAATVAEFLTSRGISPDRVRSSGLGKRVPVASNDSMSGRRENQRVEVLLLESPQ